MLTHYGRRLGLALATGALLTCSGVPSAAFADDAADATPSSTPSATPEADQPDTDPSAPPSDSPASEEPGDNGGDGSGNNSTSPTPQDTTSDAPADGDTTAPAEEDSQAPETPAPTDEATSASPAPKRLNKAAADCTPGDRSDSINNVTLTEAQADDGVFDSWELARINFSGALPDGGCAGDTVTIGLPPELNGLSGTFPVRAADGTIMGTMVVNNGGAVITFNDYVETHQNITFQGFLQAQLDDTLAPGGDYELDITVGDETFPVPVETDECPSCGQPITSPSKYANYDDGTPEPGDERVTFGISTAVTRSAGEEITITDMVDAGQEINCNSIIIRMGDSRNAWGAVVWDSVVSNAQITCSATTVTATFTSTAAGQYFRMNGHSTVTEVRDSYTDSGTVTQAGKTGPVHATAVTHSGGVDGNGDVPQPKIDIEKWSTEDGPVDGDFDDTFKDLPADQPTAISFTITNTGTEALRDVVVSDSTTAGVGTLTGLTCDFSPLGGPTSGVTWAGPFKVGDSFTCTGTLPKLGNDATHTDRATVTGIGVKSGTSVNDQDDWNGKTPEATPVTPPKDNDTPVTHPVNTPQGDNIPEKGQAPTAGLPETGANQGLLPLGLAALAMVVAGGALAWRGRRSVKQN